MGRITVFTTEGCSASIRTMAALKNRKLPFSVINLTDHPQKQVEVLTLCHRYSTPHVFFNTRYVGGYEATVALLSEWALTCEGASDSCSITGSSTVSSQDLGSNRGKDRSNKNKSKPLLYASIHDRYMVEIGNHHDPADPRLAVPLKIVHRDTDAFCRDETKQYFIKLPSGDASSILEMTVMLLDIIRHVDHTAGSTIYKQSFTGRDVIKAISAVFEIPIDEASIFSGHLLSLGIFSLMGIVSNERNDIDKAVNSQAIYRMQCLETPSILNSFCVWTEKVDQNYMRLINRLTNMMNTIQMDATDRGGTMRRERAIKHPDFPMFEEDICEIQGVHMTQMNDFTKIVSTTKLHCVPFQRGVCISYDLFLILHFKAFGINLYNLMMQYAILKIGAPDAKVKHSRVEYFAELKFNVGGYLYSLYEWEHGILRGNAKGSSCDGMSSSSIPFGRKDPRIANCVRDPDPRIHFAINHGTNSCPAVRRYSATNIDEELTVATKSFCEKESNLRFDERKLELHVSKIFTWYRSDFANDANLLPQWILNFTHGSIQQRLDFILETKNGGKPIKVIDIAFDWSMKSSWIYGVIPYESESLKMSKGRVRLAALLPKSSISKCREIRVEL